METKSKKNLSTEGKAPDTAATTSTTATDTAASTTATSTATADTNATKATAATDTTAPAATDTTKATATEQNAKGTTPATDATATTPADAEPAEQNTTTATLSVDYLKGGYYRGEGKGRYTDPALVGQAERIGTALAQSGTPASAMNKMVKTLKASSRLPYEAQWGSLEKLTPQVLDLEHKKKAPALLREVVERNQAAVQNEADFKACLEHFQNIAIYLRAAKA